MFQFLKIKIVREDKRKFYQILFRKIYLKYIDLERLKEREGNYILGKYIR